MRHLVEVPDDPEGVVDGLVERDRRVDDPREPRREPREEPQEERGLDDTPAPVRPVDRHAERVERQRRGDDERERRRLHEHVERRLLRVVGVVDVDVVRPHDHVRDDCNRPRDRDHVACDERPPRELRDEVVVDGDGREEQEVDDRVAEEPEDVLGEQRVDVDAGRERLDDHLDEQDRERKRRDDHVDADHGQRDHGICDRPRIRRESLRPEVAEPERHAEPARAPTG